MKIENIEKIISLYNYVELIGSNANDEIQFKTDYDYQVVNIIDQTLKNRKLIKKRIQGMFDKLWRLKNVYITDFKAGMFQSQPLRWDVDDIKEGFKDIDGTKIYLEECLYGDNNKIKIDLIVYLDGEYKEVSCNYYFDETDIETNIYLSLMLDIQKYYHEGKLFKMFKRIYSYRNIKGEPVDDLIDMFNSEAGFLNTLVHKIDVIQFMEEEGLTTIPDVEKKLVGMMKRLYDDLSPRLKKIRDLSDLKDKLNKKINSLVG